MNRQILNTLVLTSLLFTATNFSINSAYAKEDPNAFNRLFIPPKERVITLESDGIHDPAVKGLKLLQQPSEAFKPLPSSTAGNNVDWVKAQVKGIIKPIYDHKNPDTKPMAMDLNIVMEVKGSMPNVKFPHQAHTSILDCSNCHDAIFKPLKGGNPMSMAEIMLGKKCGVCHGSVAFPVTECRRCHSVNKKKK